MDGTPNMLYEVMEAIHLMYEDEPTVETDCMMWLKNNVKQEIDSFVVDDWFDEKHLCSDCGNRLETCNTRDYHPECGEGVYEIYTTYYCPECLGFNKEG